jgi:hypothetical protein
MSRRNVFDVRHGRIAVGSLICACIATPAFAASLRAIALDPSFHLREALLMGSLILLATALVVRITRRWRDTDSTPNGPDLRYWKHEEA